MAAPTSPAAGPSSAVAPSAVGTPKLESNANSRWRYGLIVVLVAIAAIVGVFVVAVVKYQTAADAGALVPTVATSIGTLAAAYFGIQVGSAGKEQAEQRKDEAKNEALAMAAEAPPDSAIAQSIINRHLETHTLSRF